MEELPTNTPLVVTIDGKRAATAKDSAEAKRIVEKLQTGLVETEGRKAPEIKVVATLLG